MSKKTEQSAERTRYPLERPWTRWQLIRELAGKEQTRAQLARKYDVSRSSITEFAQRHAIEIAAVEHQIEEEMAGLWIADKRNRIAVYQHNVETITELVDRDTNPKTAPRRVVDDDPNAGEVIVVGAKTPALLRVQAQILRNVAEELGQLAVRVEDVTTPPAIDPKIAALIDAARERNKQLQAELAADKTRD